MANNINGLSLVIPNLSHETEYCRVMDKWEALETNIQPELMRRYSSRLDANVPFTQWLAWCEDDRTTGSMLSTHVPCTLYFLINCNNEILGSIVINQKIPTVVIFMPVLCHGIAARGMAQ